MSDLPSNPAALAAYLSGDLANTLRAETEGGIEAQEEAGQRALVREDVLPRVDHFYKPLDRAFWERLGFQFLQEVDAWFVRVAIPPGWRKLAGEHPMWSYLVNPDGLIAARLFYKAAFYDRSAFLVVVDPPEPLPRQEAP